MINEDTIKRSLLYMNYDSKKTLSENLDRVILNEGTTSKEYILRMRYNNSMSMALQTFKVPKGLPITKRGNIIEIGKANTQHFYGYGCDNKNFVYLGTFTGSQNAAYENDEFAKLLDEEYCSKGESSTSSFDWMANNNDNYWQVLKTKLENTKPLIPYVKEGTDKNTGPFYYWGKFVIWRNHSGNFVSSKDPSATAKIDPTNYKGKYAGQPALSDIKLIVNGTNEKMSLLDFISKYTSKKDEKVVDNTKEKKKSGGGGTGTSTGWNTTCTGTYSMGCKTSEVGQAQQCLKDDGLYPYTVDNKFGSKTRNAIKAKIGKSSFTDADLQTICKTKQGGGGDDLSDFDKEMGGRSGEQEKEDTTWTGDVY